MEANDYEASKAIAERFLEQRSPGRVAIVEDRSIKSGFGWVFFYETRAYLLTGNLLEKAYGNGPLLVDLQAHCVVQLGTASNIEDGLREYGTLSPAARRSRAVFVFD